MKTPCFFWKVKVEKYYVLSPVNLNIPTEILAFPLFRCRVKMDSQTQIGFLPYFHIFIGSQKELYRGSIGSQRVFKDNLWITHGLPMAWITNSPCHAQNSPLVGEF